MPKKTGVEYPERPLMATLSDLLGIGHFTTSKGGTVRRDFLEAVCAALGVERSRIQAADKDGVLRLAVESATGRPMPDSLFSRGATVTNDALQAIINGVVESISQGRAGDFIPHRLSHLREGSDELVVVVDRLRRLREEAVRQGQSAFRRRLLEIYGNQCCISGANAVQALDAAHIIPFSGSGSDSPNNGLLLRSDLHRLFDAGALAVNDQYCVVLADHLKPTSYHKFEDVLLRAPRHRSERPSLDALRAHRLASGL